VFYLLNPFIIDRRNEINTRKASIIHENSNKYKLLIAPISKNRAKFIVESKNRKYAYDIYHIIKAYYYFVGETGGNYDFSKSICVYEYNKLPLVSWKKNDWYSNLNKEVHIIEPNDWLYHNIEIQSGDLVTINESLKEFINSYFERDNIIESVNSLIQSRNLFDGEIDNNFPNQRYREPTVIISANQEERIYFENRCKLELSYLAAFKGLELLFNVNSIKKENIDEMLIKFNDGNDGNSFYYRKHEIKVGLIKLISVRQLIKHFLDIRNTVGAHGNKNPPFSKRVSMYAIYEIQDFLENRLLAKLNI